MSKIIEVVHMFSRDDSATRAYREARERMEGWPDLKFTNTSRIIEGQGIRKRYMSGEGTKLRGLKIAKFFFDEVGPFWGQEHVDKFKGVL